MKTIYTSHVTSPLRLEISDEQIETVNQARDRVFSLAMENPNWRPSLQIDIPREEELSCHAKKLVMNVTWGSGTQDNYHNRLSNALLGRESRGWVMADLGHHCYDGWEPAIDDKDFSELNDVHFEKQFVEGFTHPSSFRTHRDEWKGIVLPEHQRMLIPKIYRDANLNARSLKNSRYSDYQIQEMEESIKVAQYCREVWKGNKSFADLEDYTHELFVESHPKDEYQDDLDEDDEFNFRGRERL